MRESVEVTQDFDLKASCALGLKYLVQFLYNIAKAKANVHHFPACVDVFCRFFS